MSQIPEKADQSAKIVWPKDPTVGWGIFFYDCLAAVFWLYTITTLFVFDLTRYIFDNFAPDSAWILDFKALFFLGIVAFVALLARKLKLLFWIFYILAFPLVLFFWKMPKHVFKTGNLNIIFYFVFTTMGFFKNLKFNVIAGFAGAMSSSICLFSQNHILLYVSSASLLVLLAVTLVSRVVSVFRPSDAFVLFRKMTNSWQQHVVKQVSEDARFEKLALISPDSGNVSDMISNVEQAMMANRVLLFSAKSLRDYQNSGMSAISGVFVTVYLMLMTIIVFSFAYFAAYKIDPANYTFTAAPTGFTFFALSFKSMFFAGINELNPSTNLSQGINILQNFLSMFIGVIFVSIIFTSKNQALSYQLEQTIKKAEEDGRAIEYAMLGRYKIGSLEELVLELRRLKAGGVIIIDFLTRRL